MVHNLSTIMVMGVLGLSIQVIARFFKGSGLSVIKVASLVFVIVTTLTVKTHPPELLVLTGNVYHLR